MDLPTLTSFACYYGPNRLNDLATYDLVIVQPAHYQPDDLAWLHRAGVVCLAYLSLGELPETDASPACRLIDPHSGRPVRNPRWSTVYLDCRLPAWQDHILHVSVPAILARGFDGLFLDTLDAQELFPVTRDAMAQLVAQLRSRFPHILLASNRGFSLLELIAPQLDIFVFEAFSTHCQDGQYVAWSGADLAWTERKAAQVRALSLGRPILALDYGTPEGDTLRRVAEDRAAQHAFLSFVTTCYLDWLPARAGAGRRPLLGGRTVATDMVAASTRYSRFSAARM